MFPSCDIVSGPARLPGIMCSYTLPHIGECTGGLTIIPGLECILAITQTLIEQDNCVLIFAMPDSQMQWIHLVRILRAQNWCNEFCSLVCLHHQREHWLPSSHCSPVEKSVLGGKEWGGLHIKLINGLSNPHSNIMRLPIMDRLYIHYGIPK